jgi:hypothetical protein
MFNLVPIRSGVGRIGFRSSLLHFLLVNRNHLVARDRTLVRTQANRGAHFERMVGKPYPTGLGKSSSSSIPNMTCAKTSEVQLTSCLKSPATRARFQTW